MQDDRSNVGHYGPGYGERNWQLQPDDVHHHYQRFREEHGRRLDEDYRQWRGQRADASFDEFRRSRDPLGQRDPIAPEHEGALHSLGRAVSETVTGTRPPELEERERSERFFERS